MKKVLILVIVDYGGSHLLSTEAVCNGSVLILVIVDYGGSMKEMLESQYSEVCFNPCYSGLWWILEVGHLESSVMSCFNPCYS